jgi:exonuclease III
MYGMFDAGYADTTMHRILSDLTPLLDGPLWRRIVMGGDLNVSTQTHGGQRKRDDTVFKRLESLGLVDLLAENKPERVALTDCWCDEKGRCQHVQTHRHSKSELPWHNDYLFASKDLADRLESCAPVPVWDWTLSDHRPVVAAFSEAV